MDSTVGWSPALYTVVASKLWHEIPNGKYWMWGVRGQRPLWTISILGYLGWATLQWAGPPRVLGSEATFSSWMHPVERLCGTCSLWWNWKGVKAALQWRGGYYMINDACRSEDKRTYSFHPPISNVEIQGSLQKSVCSPSSEKGTLQLLKPSTLVLTIFSRRNLPLLWQCLKNQRFHHSQQHYNNNWKWWEEKSCQKDGCVSCDERKSIMLWAESYGLAR